MSACAIVPISGFKSIRRDLYWAELVDPVVFGLSHFREDSGVAVLPPADYHSLQIGLYLEP